MMRSTIAVFSLLLTAACTKEPAQPPKSDDHEHHAVERNVSAEEQEALDREAAKSLNETQAQVEALKAQGVGTK
jgi:hypothetical protein